MAKLLTREEFIHKAKNIHGDKYDYSKVIYVNNHNKVKIFCKNCQDYFEQTPNNHLTGNGCKKCSYKKRALDKICSLTDFIKKARLVHKNKYDYSKSKYVSAKTNILIKCNTCNHIFMQLPNNHLRGMGCPYCFGNKWKGKNEFVKKAKQIHRDNYNYDQVEYKNNRTKVKIFCNNCKQYFYQIPSNHLIGQGCPYCVISKGENIIKDFLDKLKIVYKQQHKFKECKDVYCLPFDFYLLNLNICIEFQGKQHYDEGFDFYISYNKGNLEKALKQFQLQQKHDQIKRNFCKTNNIKLIEIKYNEQIEEKLENELKPYIKSSGFGKFL